VYEETLDTRSGCSAPFAFAGTAQAQIKMGVDGPLTGPNAAFGAQLKNGTDQAVEDINAAGGIMGQKIASATATTCPIRSRASRVANKFAGGRRQVRGRPFNSGVTMPASEVYQESGILEVTPSPPTRRSPSAACGTSSAPAAATISRARSRRDWILKNMKGKKVAIVHDKTTYGQGLADETKKGLNKGGMKEVMYEGVNLGEKDFSRSSPRSRPPAPTSSTGAACTPKAA
jgi:branched-chain amino acid transport system substrate-binding protein